MEQWTQTLGAPALLGIAVAAVAVLLFLIMRLRMHAFVALILVSLLTAFATGIPAGSVVGVLTDGFGGTLASVALLVGLGAMLGRLVETSGGAQALAATLVRRFGDDRAPLALGVASLIFGFPIFFDAGLVVMLPVVFATGRRLNAPLLLFGLPVAGAFSVMHVFVPPHPGPVAASELLGANSGFVLLAGLVVAVPTWYVTSYLFSKWAGRRFPLSVPDILSGGKQDKDPALNPPSAGTIVLLLVLPVLLIFLNTGLDMARAEGLVDAEASWYGVLSTIGATPVALLISVIVAAVVLGNRRGVEKSALEKTLDSALGPVASVILITGAGGMFGGVLRSSGIGDALSGTLQDLGLPVILAAFIIALLLRVAQGSATVALITAASLVQPAVAAGGFSELQLAAIVLATAAGSVGLSHVNDSGFWLVGRLFDMDVKTTLKTWTVLETLIAVMGFALACAIFLIF
ncbi:GntP family permease [Georgenia wangjunii]|uniref:GntP family permease n=1 Tax=Georgenia wangjunii TaxID=3117730 RepID=UPI002F26014A